MQEFNLKRLEQLEELLDIQYDKLHEYEKELAMSSGPEKISLKLRMKMEIVPELKKYEKEYAELLAEGVDEDAIAEDEAAPIVAELVAATSDLERYRQAKAPEEMLQLLNEIRAKLEEPGTSAAAKLKVTLPIIPLLASYELELDTENFLNTVWDKARSLFRRVIPRNPR
ncbi:MAG: hypothetical protein IID08_02745 [Candidatus Hydrogenedentes bacterium]|nr:hypothetical protein [Candidatus Hydrogenedentota bacterium]